PNTFSEVTGDLDAGANALEPDVMSFTDLAMSPSDGQINGHAGPSGLFMYHDHVLLTTRLPDTVESWLDFVHAKVVAGQNVALIAFDIKSAAATAANGPKLLKAVHDHLNFGGVNVNVIFSVGSEDDSAIFSQLIPALGPREGVMIDADNDPVKIYNFFKGLGADGHIAYGNGSLGVRYGFAPNVLLGIEEASWVRAGQAPTFAIPYAYPIDLASDMNAFITAGADGIIADIDFPIVPPIATQGKIAELAALVASRDDVYMATAADDPLHPVVEAYAIRVATLDVAGGGTDSNITFTLTGCDGTSSVTVDTEFIGHMEAGGVNFVTLPSKDLGQLQSLTLSSDGSRGVFGNQPWHPDSVQISSAGWGIPFADKYTVVFNDTDDTVDAGTPKTRTTGAWGNRCGSTTTVASSVNPSTYGQSVTFSSTVSAVSGSTKPTGTVDFLDGASLIGSGTIVAGTATLTTGALSVGSHQIQARYTGDSHFRPSMSSVVSQVVRIAATTTTLMSATNPSVHGQPVLLTVTTVAVAPGAGIPTGQVQLYDGATLIATGTLAGGSYAASFQTLSTTVHSLTAKYLGNASFSPSTSPMLRQLVNRAPTTVTLTATPGATTGFGDVVTFTAAVSVPPPGAGQPTGSVAFAVDGAVVQTMPLSPTVQQVSVATSSLGAGPHVVTATYQGDVDFLPSTATVAHSVVCSVTVTTTPRGGIKSAAGSTCLSNMTVNGSIVVGPGESLNLRNVTVTGSVVATGGPGSIRICGSTIGGSVIVKDAQGLVVIGDEAAAACAPNIIDGALMLDDNTHGVRAIDNVVQNVHASGNSGPGPYPGVPTSISGGRNGL
ncbi:MAG: hypothetical protein QOG52_2897, partial [Frankiaceae bacterium]|nr:hypothetical protein [Frankiaceae bacterium]